MARKVRTTFIYVVALLFFLASIYHHFLSAAISAVSSASPSPTIIPLPSSAANNGDGDPPIPSPPVISTTSVLLPDWEVLLIASPETHIPDGSYSCLFTSGEITPANYTGVMPFPDRATVSCIMPMRERRNLPYRQPVLLTDRNPPPPPPTPESRPPLMIRSTYMVYDSLTTDDDVVLFVKGVNERQGLNRDPSEFRCVFGDEGNGVRTAVTSSMQEVFRCKRPPLTAVINEEDGDDRTIVRVSIEIAAENAVVPSVAYYTPPRKLASNSGKALLCATTMVYDVTKFLKEWVSYHSEIGVEKFLLYDNGSDDDLGTAAAELVKEGFDVNTYFWRWPKTQEAGFSHSAVYAKDVCSWMLYLDVDEFVYSPTWQNFSRPSKSLLHGPLTRPRNSSLLDLGQVSFGCLEFGPSDQTGHPEEGVVQGYNCRRKFENRHKSTVLLDAVDDSLLNVVHHFILKKEYRGKKLGVNDMVVNHYKYQAWTEFKAKFRRRVSAYVLDWKQKLNPHSNDRTPGLGFEPVEPEGWPQRFCEVRDERLKDLTRRWFGIESGTSGFRMAWQR